MTYKENTGSGRGWGGVGVGLRRKLQSRKQHFDTPMYPLCKELFQAAKTVTEFTVKTETVIVTHNQFDILYYTQSGV